MARIGERHERGHGSLSVCCPGRTEWSHLGTGCAYAAGGVTPALAFALASAPQSFPDLKAAVAAADPCPYARRQAA